MILIRPLLLHLALQLLILVLRAATILCTLGLSLLILHYTASMWLAFVPYVGLSVYMAWDIRRYWQSVQADIRMAKQASTTAPTGEQEGVAR